MVRQRDAKKNPNTQVLLNFPVYYLQLISFVPIPTFFYSSSNLL